MTVALASALVLLFSPPASQAYGLVLSASDPAPSDSSSIILNSDSAPINMFPALPICGLILAVSLSGSPSPLL